MPSKLDFLYIWGQFLLGKVSLGTNFPKIQFPGGVGEIVQFWFIDGKKNTRYNIPKIPC